MEQAMIDPYQVALALRDVRAELESQDKKWGEQNHPDGTGVYMPELPLTPGIEATFQQTAEHAKYAYESAVEHGYLTWRHVLQEEFFEALAESDPEKLRAELIQVAAVAVQWILSIDRRTK